jgi:dimeric dUTPase (all-alpha-NTP-PPase superfamily)
MKVLLATLITFSALASDVCGTSSLWKLRNESNYKEVHASKVLFTEEEFNKIPELNDGFEYEYCKDAIKRVDLKHKITGEFVSLFYTIEDNCDGGNSYGAVMNDDGEFFATIQDSDISCDL